MKIVIRVDASISIGYGHVMRCLTLADVLKTKNINCEFICREHPGNLIKHIINKGYKTHIIPMGLRKDNYHCFHDWLGASISEDAKHCEQILSSIQPEWLIVDHYALDKNWEKKLSNYYHKLMIIDDLADRDHECQILLDQTFGRSQDEYKPLVPRDCNILCGSNYAMLRPDFAELREYSLNRRKKFKLKRLLISMGGIDKNNSTSYILNSLQKLKLPSECEITIVLSSESPWLNNVHRLSKKIIWRTKVLVDEPEMAKLMAESDLAIGAAGTSSWERCCLGLPTILMILADNQREIAKVLIDRGAAILFDDLKNSNQNFSDNRLYKLINFELIGKKSASIVDGLGTKRVVECLIGDNKNAN
jgi:UDP-2,4-diacetamido-2,4,6-trideoxy-beta-L-altropyranose hydrolase